MALTLASSSHTATSTSTNKNIIQNGGYSAKKSKGDSYASYSNLCKSLPHFKFNVDHLVWAKLDNHPWWPCKIVKEFPEDSNSSYVKLISILTYNLNLNKDGPILICLINFNKLNHN